MNKSTRHLANQLIPYIRGKLLKGCDDFVSLLRMSIQELKNYDVVKNRFTVDFLNRSLIERNLKALLYAACPCSSARSCCWWTSSSQRADILWQIHGNTPWLVVFQRVSTINCLSELWQSIILLGDIWSILISPHLSPKNNSDLVAVGSLVHHGLWESRVSHGFKHSAWWSHKRHKLLPELKGMGPEPTELQQQRGETKPPKKAGRTWQMEELTLSLCR